VSAQVITESKRRLRVLEFELGERTIDEVEKTNNSKYHKVRHFGTYFTCLNRDFSLML
jgi:hypothetical protein